MEQKKSKGKEKGIIGKKKGGTAVAFRPQDIIDAKFDLDCFGQDILDAVFARVGEGEDADDNLTYTLWINDMKKMYRTADQSNKYKQLKTAVKSLEREGFTFINADGHETYYPWFSKIVYVPSGNSEMSHIEVDIHKDVKKLIIEATNGAFYNAEKSCNIRGKYSRKLYYQLLNRQNFRGGRAIITIDELRWMLGIPESYNTGMVQKRVLEPAKVEIEENGEISFTYKPIYEPVKRGRPIVSSFEFIIERSRSKKSYIDTTSYEVIENGMDEDKLVGSIVTNLGITQLEAWDIINTAKRKGYIKPDGNMKQLADIIKYCMKQKPVKPTNYILKILENGFVEPKVKKKEKNKGSLLNQYANIDYDEFESQILAN